MSACCWSWLNSDQLGRVLCLDAEELVGRSVSRTPAVVLDRWDAAAGGCNAPPSEVTEVAEAPDVESALGAPVDVEDTVAWGLDEGGLLSSVPPPVT